MLGLDQACSVSMKTTKTIAVSEPSGSRSSDDSASAEQMAPVIVSVSEEKETHTPAKNDSGLSVMAYFKMKMEEAARAKAAPAVVPPLQEETAIIEVASTRPKMGHEVIQEVTTSTKRKRTKDEKTASKASKDERKRAKKQAKESTDVQHEPTAGNITLPPSTTAALSDSIESSPKTKESKQERAERKKEKAARKEKRRLKK